MVGPKNRTGLETARVIKRNSKIFQLFNQEIRRKGQVRTKTLMALIIQKTTHVPACA